MYKMMKKYYLLSTLCGLAFLSSCKDDYTFHPEYPLKVEVDREVEANVDVAETFQIIDGFGASDAWLMDIIGKYWSKENKEGIAKLLFSREKDENGNPEGIGLSMWRFNVGAGTVEKGHEGNIEEISTRTECFLQEDGSYAWNKQQGQQYFMEKAKEYGCEQFVLFSNSAPVWYTKNGLGHTTNGENNLKLEHYGDFADFLANVTAYFQSKGYNIPFVSPVNEPEYEWTGGQEGCRWSNEDLQRLAIELERSFSEKELKTMLLLTESGHWDYLYSVGDRGPLYGNKIEELFIEGGKYYIGNLPHVPNIICAHSYYLDETWDILQETREKVNEVATANGLKVYQSEWSMLGGAYEDYPSYDEASYMDLALSMAKVIYHDLVTGNMSSWCYWTAVAREIYSQNCRFYLVRVIPADGDYGDVKQSGSYSSSKNLWVLGNYSLFVKPGYQRVALNIPESSRKFFGSAYISPEQDQLVIVYNNLSDENIKVNTSLNGINNKIVLSCEQYTTSASKDLKLEEDYRKGIIPSKSVVTFVYTLK